MSQMMNIYVKEMIQIFKTINMHNEKALSLQPHLQSQREILSHSKQEKE
jgi:hypothetical protein